MSWRTFHSSLARLFFGFDHRQHPMNAAQRARYDQRVAKLSHADRRGRMLSLVPGVVTMIMIPFWVRIEPNFRFPSRLLFESVFAACVTVYVVWLIRRRHLTYGPRALRELGFADICARCGYDLSRQPRAEGACPECGERFSQFHPDKAGATYQR